MRQGYLEGRWGSPTRPLPHPGKDVFGRFARCKLDKTFRTQSEGPATLRFRSLGGKFESSLSRLILAIQSKIAGRAQAEPLLNPNADRRDRSPPGKHDHSDIAKFTLVQGDSHTEHRRLGDTKS